MDLITVCECGHDSTDHVRVIYAAHVCSACSCTDHAPVIPDDETIEDILHLLAS